MATIAVLVISGLPGGASSPAVTPQTRGSRALVLDQEARTLTALALPSGRVEQTAALQGRPSSLLRTADGQRLLVLDRGEGRDAGDKGYQAKTRAAVTIVDGRTLAVRGRVDARLGAGPDGDAVGRRGPSVGGRRGVHGTQCRREPAP
ncbi:MAG: hypothetical protein AB7H93_20440 [Vicinamibacterales bacterium]